jgi:hypothetical protein
MIIRRSTHPLLAKAKTVAATASARAARVVDRLRPIVKVSFPETTPQRGWGDENYEEGGSISFRVGCFQVNLAAATRVPGVQGVGFDTRKMPVARPPLAGVVGLS